MKNLNRINNFSFAVIATTLIVTAGLVIGLTIPSISSWQQTNIDKLLRQASTSEDSTIKLNLLSQAAMLGKNDPLATYTYANALWQAGDYEASLNAYTNSWLELDYNYLGALALKAGKNSEAKKFFSMANSEGENDESLTGLAIVEFNADNAKKGCEYAAKAQKLNLSSPKAEQAVAICQIKQGESKLPQREQAYTLLNSYIYNDSLARLQKIETKNASDWDAIASIYASRGELSQAIEALKSSLDKSPANIAIIQKLIKCLELQNKSGEAQIYKERLQDLKFENFPNNKLSQ